MNNKLNRKEFIKESAKYAAGISAGLVGLNLIGNKSLQAKAQYEWPFPYTELDVEAVRIKGHDAYFSGKGCSYGAFHAIVEQLREAIGEPYISFPTEIMIYGHGGTVGWGTLCGALNGAAALMSLVCDKATSDVLINELVGWYTQTAFPSDQSNEYGVNQRYGNNKYTQALPQNTCGSPLCHVSVSTWCNVSGFKVSNLERKERCGRLTGDVAARAVEILNAHFAGTFTAEYTPSETIAACMMCHGANVFDNVASNLECKQCHGDPHSETAMEREEPLPADYSLNQNYPNPFNPSTTISFSVPISEKITLSIYDINGRHIKTLIDNQYYPAGKHTVQWDGSNVFGQKISSGMYYYHIRAGKFNSTKSMLLVK